MLLFRKAGAIKLGDLKICFLSGIFNKEYFHIQRPIVSDINHKSNKLYAYFNEYDIDKLMNFKNVDILLTHEWPDIIVDDSNKDLFTKQLLSIKYESVGNTYVSIQIALLKPRIVFCGHMHYRYERVINSKETNIKITCLPQLAELRRSLHVLKLLKNGSIEHSEKVNLCTKL